jgi:hypothetical protein
MCSLLCCLFSNQIVCSLLMAKVVAKWDSWVHKV